MKLSLILCFSILLTGCIEEENCESTGEVDHVRCNDNQEFFTVCETVYKMRCE